jgi:hypothetical protein
MPRKRLRCCELVIWVSYNQRSRNNNGFMESGVLLGILQAERVESPWPADADTQVKTNQCHINPSKHLGRLHISLPSYLAMRLPLAQAAEVDDVSHSVTSRSLVCLNQEDSANSTERVPPSTTIHNDSCRSQHYIYFSALVVPIQPNAEAPAGVHSRDVLALKYSTQSGFSYI